MVTHAIWGAAGRNCHQLSLNAPWNIERHHTPHRNLPTTGRPGATTTLDGPGEGRGGRRRLGDSLGPPLRRKVLPSLEGVRGALFSTNGHATGSSLAPPCCVPSPPHRPSPAATPGLCSCSALAIATRESDYVQLRDSEERGHVCQSQCNYWSCLAMYIIGICEEFPYDIKSIQSGRWVETLFARQTTVRATLLPLLLKFWNKYLSSVPADLEAQTLLDRQ